MTVLVVMTLSMRYGSVSTHTETRRMAANGDNMLEKMPAYLRKRLQEILADAAAEEGIPILDVTDGTAMAVPYASYDGDRVSDVESLIVYYAEEYLAIFDTLVEEGRVELEEE